MNEQVEAAVGRAVLRRDENFKENWKRYHAISLLVCPDCGDELRQTSGAFRYFVMGEKKYECSGCGASHTHYLVD